MKRQKKIALFAAFCLLFTVAFAFGAFAAESDKPIRYTLDSFLYEDDQLTLTGYFENISENRDVYGLKDATLTVFDKNGTQLTAIECNSTDLGEVLLNPGEQWKYTTIRKIEGLDTSGFDLSMVTANCTYTFSSAKHKTSNCSTCKDWGERDYKTTDKHVTLSEDTLKKLKAALASETASEEETKSSSSKSGSATKKKYTIEYTECTKCGGTGKVTCPTCDGVGYKEYTKKRTCLISHHSDCPARKSLGKCYGCHKAHDYYTAKETCTLCKGKKTIGCTNCSGTGKKLK